VLTPAQMLQRIGQRLDLLATRHADVPSRHRTLRASIEWSYGLLDERERSTFAALSVFRGGWTLEAAEATLGNEERSPIGGRYDEFLNGSSVPRSEVIELLDGLRTASLIVAEERGEEMRYRMLETIREFAAERLDEIGAEDVRRRHAEYFAELAETARPHLERADPEWVERLGAEHDNVRAALERCGSGWAPAETGLRIVAGWWSWWGVRGYLREGRAAIEAALANCPDASPALRAKALTADAHFCVLQGDSQAGTAREEASLAIWRERGDRLEIARSLTRLANVAFMASEPDRAAALAEEGFALARELGDGELLASSLLCRGMIAQNRGDHDVAVAALEEALPMFHDQNRRQQIIWTLFWLAGARLARLDLDRAEALYEEALAAARASGHVFQVAAMTLSLADVKRYQGEYDRAEALCLEAVEGLRALGALASVPTGLHLLGAIHRLRGEQARAGEIFRESVSMRAETGNWRYVPNTFEELAALAAETGRAERAARLLGAAEALREAHGTPLAPADWLAVDSATAPARETLGDEAFEAARAAGRALTLDEAVSEALS
jgi:tetratricopeptide (TPR) repeat protein